MKKKQILMRIITAMILCVILTGATCLSAFAAPGADPADPEAGAAETSPEDPDTGEGGESTLPEETPTEPSGEDVTEADPDTQIVTEEPTEAQEEPIDEPTEAAYIPPEHLDDLDPVDPDDVETATAVPVPRAEVSDASLLSGIIMWLCVAVGVAVVVGVMVSKRTRRRG